MKRIFTAILMIATFTGFAQGGQNGGEVYLKIKNNAGTKGEVYRTGSHLNVIDSTIAAINLAIKLKTDSIYTKLGTGITATVDSSSQRISIKVKEIPALSASDSNKYRISLKIQELPALSATDSAKYRVALKVIELPALLATDSVKYRISMKVQELPAITGTVTANAGTNLNTSLLALESGGNLASVVTNTNSLNTAEAASSSGLRGPLVRANATTDAPSFSNGNAYGLSMDLFGATRVLMMDDAGNPITSFGGGTQYTDGGATPTHPTGGIPVYDKSGTVTGVSLTNRFPVQSTVSSMTVTNLHSLANSATVGWRSDTLQNINKKALDWKVFVKLDMANTSPANDKAAYVYVVPWYYDGSTWYSSSQGSTTLPAATEGANTIVSPNNLRLLGVLAYSTADAVVQDNFLISNAFGGSVPDAFSIVIINFSGATLAASGNVVNCKPIYKTQR
jgi:hypothetical protein